MDHSLPGSSVHGDSPGKNTGVGYHALLQGIFPTQGSNPRLMSPASGGEFFIISATWEARIKLQGSVNATDPLFFLGLCQMLKCCGLEHLGTGILVEGQFIFSPCEHFLRLVSFCFIFSPTE